MEPPVPPPEPLFDAIGRVAFAWSGMESEFGQLLAALLHTPMAALMSVGQNFAVMHSQIEAIHKLPPQAEQYDTPRQRLTDEQRAHIGEVMTQSKTLSDKRSRIVHGLWVATDDGSAWINAKPQRYRLFVRPERLTIEEMHQAARDLEAPTARIKQLGANVDHRLYGLPEAPELDP
jgi:hypothetical protein